jgi:hypothetical protein
MAEQTQAPQLPPPPPELKVFEKDVGTWDAEVAFFAAPGAPPHLSRGVAESRLIAGGRWLVTDFKNATTGFEGHGVFGWDQARGRYTGVWVDPARTSLVVADGAWDEAKRAMTFSAEAQFGDKKVRWREVTETKDADTQIFRSLFPLPGGGEFEMMTVTYRRRR